jgi:hypothetical protein
MRTMSALVSAIAVFSLVMEVHAQCPSCAAKTTATSTCPAGGCSETGCASGCCGAVAVATTKACPVTAAMEKLPKLTYAVGEKTVCCPKEAAALAKAANSQIRYCVAEKKFDSEADAQKALVEATETFVAAVAQPYKCPKSGQLTLAGQAQSCEKTAAKNAELMQAAMAKVAMTYVVGDKSCNCPVEAKQVAKDSGKEVLFVVGQEKTSCEQTARLNLARAKYKAAIEALVKAQSAPANQTAGA